MFYAPPPSGPAAPSVLRGAAQGVVIAAGSWWLLGQLATVLRPMLVAVFLGYVLLPYYRRLRRRLPAGVAVGLLAGATTLLLAGLASAVYGSLLGFRDEVPLLQDAAAAAVRRAVDAVNRTVPAWAHGAPGRPAEEAVAGLLTEGTKQAVNAAAGGMVEALTAGLYLVFLLIESERFGRRVRAAYPPDRADRILHAAGRINAAIISYLKAKVKSSLVLTVPVWAVLTALGLKYAFLWAILTFLCNFIPYLGSVVAYSLPVGFAFLQLDPGARPVLAAGFLLLFHVASATVIEPTILGRAVGLSPLVILAALSVWGLLWGLPGMFLAVPLTVVLKLAAENIDATRPAARLLSGD